MILKVHAGTKNINNKSFVDSLLNNESIPQKKIYNLDHMKSRIAEDIIYNLFSEILLFSDNNGRKEIELWGRLDTLQKYCLSGNYGANAEIFPEFLKEYKNPVAKLYGLKLMACKHMPKNTLLAFAHLKTYSDSSTFTYKVIGPNHIEPIIIKTHTYSVLKFNLQDLGLEESSNLVIRRL